MAEIILSVEDLRPVIEQTVRIALKDLHSPDKLMTREEVAKWLRVDVSTVTRHMKEGMPYLMVGDRPRYKKEEVEQWMRTSR